MSHRPKRAVAVCNYLLENFNLWVPGYELTTPEVGGSEGLKRLRELRQKGFKIDGRRMDGADAWEYRMTGVK